MTAGRYARCELTAPLGDFSVDALRQATGTVCSLESVARAAVYYYLAERDAGRVAWRYPDFIRHSKGQDPPGVVLSFKVDEAAWRAFRREAEAQAVGPDLLIRHAVLYFSADVDAGRVARRVLDELASED